MKAYLVEFLGTFLLVLTILLCVQNGLGNLTIVIVGIVLTIIIYSGGPISGAHYNPAVSLGFLIRKRIRFKIMLLYVICQILAALLAFFISSNPLLSANERIIYVVDAFNPIHGMIVEFLGTFALVWVILCVATYSKTKGNNYYGIAIALTVIIGSFLFGSISGAAFNPSVALGLCISELSSWTNFPYYLFSEFLAATTATVIFNKYMGD